MKKILLVEDDEDDQFFFIEALNEIEDASLFAIAGNGQEAMAKLQDPQHLPDLVFMDINMPLMNGLECLALMTNDPSLQKIPVVILSSATDDKDVVQKLGAKAFIKKPDNVRTLRNKMQEMINMDFLADIQTTQRSLQVSYNH